jgi:hypothetical protein
MGLGCSVLIEDPTMERLLEAADHELYAMKWLKKHPSATAPEAYQYPRATDVALVVTHRTEEAHTASTVAPSSSDETAQLRSRKSEV